MKTIIVTKEDIKNGKPRNSRECPVSLAMQRVIGGPVSVGYCTFTVLTGESDHIRNHRLKNQTHYFGEDIADLEKASEARVVSRLSHDFDDGKKIAPFQFEVNL